MQIFEHPHAIIIIFTVSFILLGAFGIYFASKGLKTANGTTKNNFTSISKIENDFKRLGKQCVDRSILYISVSADDPRDLYSQSDILTEIKNILISTFASDESEISIYDEKNFIVIANWDIDTSQENIENCQSELNKCLLKHGALNTVTIRIGLYFALGTQVTFEQAINRAKQACTLARNKNLSYVQWDSSSGKALENKIKIENNIEKEIDNNHFFLEYQPVLDANTREIIGAEVLSRLNSQTDGILPPRSFLAAVDSLGINEKFDYYIFEKNCKWISNDKKQREGYRYTINFSRSTLSEPAFAEKIISIAEKYDLKFSCLAVEILEDKNLTGDKKKQMIDNLSMLKEKGVSILLDDFGSGYTTFGDLQNLDISIVKIDKSITQNAVTDTGFIILKNIIQTSKDIGFKTLCEGIETKEQEEAVIKAGCDLLQGFYYYRPMSVAMLEKLLDKN